MCPQSINQLSPSTQNKNTQVLVRLKVEYSGFFTVNNQRFGQRCVHTCDTYCVYMYIFGSGWINIVCIYTHIHHPHNNNTPQRRTKQHLLHIYIHMHHPPHSTCRQKQLRRAGGEPHGHPPLPQEPQARGQRGERQRVRYLLYMCIFFFHVSWRGRAPHIHRERHAHAPTFHPTTPRSKTNINTNDNDRRAGERGRRRGGVEHKEDMIGTLERSDVRGPLRFTDLNMI